MSLLNAAELYPLFSLISRYLIGMAGETSWEQAECQMLVDT